MVCPTLVSSGLTIILMISLIGEVEPSPTLSNRRKTFRKKLGTVASPKASRVPAFDQDLRLHKAMLEGSHVSFTPLGPSKVKVHQDADRRSDSKSSETNSIVSKGSVETNEIKRKTSWAVDDRTPSNLLYKSANKPDSRCSQDSKSIDTDKAQIHADLTDCSQFIYCVSGKPVVYTCPWPTLWDDDKKTCNWYYNVNCKN